MVIGGKIDADSSYGTKTVTEYSQFGFVKYWTPMNTARRQHACSKFAKDNGDTVCHNLYFFFQF